MGLTRVQQNTNEEGRRILHKGCKQQVERGEEHEELTFVG
jgi:hypothetical protein